MLKNSSATAYPVAAVVCCYGYPAKRSVITLDGYLAYLSRVANRLIDLSNEGRLMAVVFSGGITQPTVFPGQSEARAAYQRVMQLTSADLWKNLPFLYIEEDSKNTPQNIYYSVKCLSGTFRWVGVQQGVHLTEEMQERLRWGQLKTFAMLPEVQIFCDKPRVNKARVIARRVNHLLRDPKEEKGTITTRTAVFRVVGIPRRDTDLVSRPLVQNLQALRMHFKPGIVDDLIGI